jgi:hypothetical protein
MVGGQLGVSGHSALCHVAMVTSAGIEHAATLHLNTKGHHVRERICRLRSVWLEAVTIFHKLQHFM